MKKSLIYILVYIKLVLIATKIFICHQQCLNHRIVEVEILYRYLILILINLVSLYNSYVKREMKKSHKI